jgi:VanZ family protein
MNGINPANTKRALICFGLTILAVSPLIPDGNMIIPRITPLVQNILHVPVFAILSVLLFLIFSDYRIDPLKSIVLVILISQTLSILTESIQLFIPGRCPSFGDIGSNFIGMSSGIFLVLGMKKIRSAIAGSLFHF